ncbi:MAG: ISNCY family transposase [Anaerolineales bacterium]
MVTEIRQSFEGLPDHRTGENTRYEIKDAAVSAFGIFFTQSSSFLAYQRLMEKAKGRSNVQSLFGAENIPSDTQIRNLLDGQDPELLYGVFEKGHEALVASGQMAAFSSYGGQYLISCDGTGTISSQKIGCPNCSQRELATGETLYIHYAILPVIVKTGENRVLVLEPEFISPQDGHEKQDCERAAIKRWVKRNAERLTDHKYTLLGDDLYACQPICSLFLENGFNFILVCKPDSHIALYEQVAFLEKNDLVERVSLRHWNGKYYEIQQYCWANAVPLRRGEDALQVSWCEITIRREDTGKQLYHNTFITNHTLNRNNVVPIIRDGRARWKSENETNNVLKTKGYHLEHNFGHGQQFLANFMLTLNLLAFLFHTLLDILDEQYHALRQELVARKDFFNDLRALLRYMLFDNWNHLLHFMLVGLELIPDT